MVDWWGGQIALWVLLALLAACLAGPLKTSSALVEVSLGALAQWALIASGAGLLALGAPWLEFTTDLGILLLVFLAGCEADLTPLRGKLREGAVLGLLGFLAPAMGTALVAHLFLGWSLVASLLAGVALAATSAATIYTVLLDRAARQSDWGRALLGACYLIDLSLLLALGLFFSPHGGRMLGCLTITGVAVLILPWLSLWWSRRWEGLPAAMESRLLLLCLLPLAALATWAGFDPALPAYLLGIALASQWKREHPVARDLRGFCLAFLAPCYFLRVGALVQPSAVAAQALAIPLLAVVALLARVLGTLPGATVFRYPQREVAVASLHLAGGLTFGTVAALFGLRHGLVDLAQYSTVIVALVLLALVPWCLAHLPMGRLPPPHGEEGPPS
jgi:Kef-type K+ transport system membrane component KefB